MNPARNVASSMVMQVTRSFMRCGVVASSAAAGFMTAVHKAVVY